MFIKPNITPHDILSRYLPKGTGLLTDKKPHWWGLRYMGKLVQTQEEFDSLPQYMRDVQSAAERGGYTAVFKDFKRVGTVAKPYKITNQTEFPVKEYIDTIRPPEEFPLAFQTDEERRAFFVGLGFVTAVIIFVLWLIFVN